MNTATATPSPLSSSVVEGLPCASWNQSGESSARAMSGLATFAPQLPRPGPLRVVRTWKTDSSLCSAMASGTTSANSSTITTSASLIRRREELEAFAAASFSSASAIIDAGISRVVIGHLDPNPDASGGVEVLQAAGIEVGDRIVTLDGEAIESFRDLQQEVMLHPETPMTLGVERAGRTLEFPITTMSHEVEDRFGNVSKIGLLGVESAGVEYDFVPEGPVAAIGSGVEQSVDTFSMMITGIKQIVTGQRSVRELGGPVKIAKFSGEQLSLGWIAFINFAALISLNLTFDAWLYHPQIPELTSLAQAFPEARIVLDHVGGPLGIGPYAGSHDEILPRWKKSINALAECKNVHVKLGGLVMPVNGFAWHKQAKPPSSETLAAAFEPYFMHCIEKFSPERCMFESNFPVDKVSCSYVVLWNAFKRLAENFTHDERASLFHDTACSFYGVSQ